MTDDQLEPAHTALHALAKELGIGVTQLAGRLGVNRRTLYKWDERGCPWSSERAIREWCHHEGIRVKPEADTFRDLLGQGALGTENAQDAPAGQGSLGQGDDEPMTPAALNQFHTSELRKLQAEKERMEIAALRGVHVHRDDVARAFGALGLALVAELTELPLVLLKLLPPELPSEHRAGVRKAAATAVEQLRAKLSASLRERLREALVVKGATDAR